MSNKDEKRTVGLCASCRHVKRVTSKRTTFYLCRLAATDARFAKYPALPVLSCRGYEAKLEQGGNE